MNTESCTAGSLKVEAQVDKVVKKASVMHAFILSAMAENYMSCSYTTCGVLCAVCLPHCRKDVVALVKVQRRFTGKLCIG